MPRREVIATGNLPPRQTHNHAQDIGNSIKILRPYKKRQIMRHLIFLICLLSLGASADGKLSLSTGFEYSTGDYGAASDTETWVVPLSIKYKTGDLTLKAATSWLHVTGPGGVTPEGEPIGGAGARTTETGAGDLVVSAIWEALDSQSTWANLDVGAKVKFGTADTDKSLGTGKNDFAVFAEVSKPIQAWYPFVKLGYSWRGDPTGQDYSNVWFGSAGADYRISKTMSAGLYYDWREQLTATGSEISEATAYLNMRINDSNKLNVYAISGFSDASPDWGIGMMLTHAF